MFWSSFFKSLRFPKAEPWSRSAEREIPPKNGVFSFDSCNHTVIAAELAKPISFAPTWSKRKATGKLCERNDRDHKPTNYFFTTADFSTHFSFDTACAKEKFTKENAVKRISLSADSEEGFAPPPPTNF